MLRGEKVLITGPAGRIASGLTRSLAVTKVPVAEVLGHLPSGTRTVTPDEREAQLLQRRTGAQLRRIW